MKILTESDPKTYSIVGAAMEVHRQLGCGFLEPVYQEALAIELANCGVPFRRELKFPHHLQRLCLLRLAIALISSVLIQ